MGKSNLDEIFQEGDLLISRICDEPLERLRRVGNLWQSQLADWEDLAKAEDSVRREYTGRYLFELLQNAHDTILDWFEQNHISLRDKPPEINNRVRLQLTSQSLLVGNDGLPFSENNIRALCRLHVSTKRASKQIGHKGIGFKSVLEITDCPEIYSNHFAFGFNQQELATRVNKITKNTTNVPLPILRAPFIRRLSWLSPEEREIVEDFFDKDFTTVIRLPLKENELVNKVQDKIHEIITPQILLFLEAIDQLEIFLPTGKNYSFWRRQNPSLKQRNCRDIDLWTDESGEPKIHSRWLVLEPKELPIRDHSLIEGLGEAWEDVHAVKYSAAFPLSKNGRELLIENQSRPFHVYFPTEEFSGLKFLINADFYLGSARKEIDRCALNDHLVEEIALYIASDGIDVLKREFPKDPAIVDILSLSEGEPNRKFTRYFYEQYLLALSDSAFVPLDGGHYKTPSEIRFTPKEVDMEQFRQFFPPNYLRGDEKWAYPLIDVEQREAERVEKGLGFLSNLGAQILSQDDVVHILQSGAPSHIQDQGAFVRFLAGWWDNIVSWERQSFADELAKCPIVPTQDGWKIPSKTLIFQANLRQEKAPKVPPGFAFSIIPRKIYGDDLSYDGIIANFLTALKVSPYVARDIIRRAILPKLRDEKSFLKLLEKYPQSIFDAYDFLKSYYEREGSTSDIANDLRKVPVPVFCVGDSTSRIWKAAGEAYFSQFWTKSDDLEFIFDGIEDINFFGPIDEIEELENPEIKAGWYNFFYWLGVDYIPRIIDVTYTCDLNGRMQHPFSNQAYWEQYCKEYRSAFKCTNPQKNHGYSRQMNRNERLDHFEDIIEQSDPDKCTRLFQILGGNWERYRDHLSTKFRCYYVTTGCPDETIPSYMGYCLSKIEWLPAEVGGKLKERLFCAQDIWNLGEDVRPEVKRMVPSLPGLLQQESYRAIRNDILRAEYTFSDYLDLLQRLPEIYPLYPPGLDGDALKKWQEAIRAVFNWIGQALQNILARLGEENRPELPSGLPVFAFRNNQPGYIAVNDTLLVYPDDSFLSADWEQDLWFLKIDDGWGSLRDWLGVPNLSGKVHTELIQSNKIANQTQKLIEKYHQTLPYFMCLVRDKQFSRYDGILGRLKRLSIYIVEELQILQSLQSLDLPPKNVQRAVYLQTRDDPGSRGAMVLRSGDLYITANAVGNPYILGDPIASYIEIERLADAFMLLFQLPGHDEKMRYLTSKGISKDTFRLVIEDLKAQTEGQDSSSILDTLNKLFGNDGRTPVTHPESGAIPPRTPESLSGNTQGGSSSSSSGIGGWGSGQGDPTKGGNGGHRPPSNRPRGKLRTYVIPAGRDGNGDKGDDDDDKQHHRTETDKAGIKKVLDYEIKHDRDPKEMDHTHEGYDIESVDQSRNRRYIEVKSLSGLWGERNAPGMTRPQFDYARRDGDQYWLYVVERATEEDYRIYCVQNPALRVNQYLFDDGWRELAEPED
ncbi:MAG: DUF3883 domain-containing protein [Chloroflexota bacterium]